MARKYEQKLRKKLTDETRRRIVEAAIGLHTTVGPASTTISAIAEQAGVERLTVYRHFPDEGSLFRACSSHGWALHPPPDPSAWKAFADPGARLRAGLEDLYGYYDEVGEAFMTILRDYPKVPLLAELNAPYFAEWERMREVLAQPWRCRGSRRVLLLAAISHALDLQTWYSLVRAQGLTEEQAIELMVALVRVSRSVGA